MQCDNCIHKRQNAFINPFMVAYARNNKPIYVVDLIKSLIIGILFMVSVRLLVLVYILGFASGEKLLAFFNFFMLFFSLIIIFLRGLQ